MVTARGGFTFGQTSLWRDIADLPRDRWYEANLVRRWELRGPVSEKELRSAVVVLTERHDGLRTTFSFDVEEQHVLDSVEAPIFDLSDLGEKAREEFENRAFDLAHEIGWRIGYTRTPKAVSIVAVVHHLIADGYALGILQRDLTELIEGGDVSPGVGPLTLLAGERSAIGLRRADAAIAHWDAVLDRAGSRGTLPAPSGEPLCHVDLATGLTREALQASLPTNVSLMALILATFVAEASRTPFAEPAAEASAESDDLFVRLMISNRTSPERRRSITTMNEWVAVLVPKTQLRSGVDVATVVASSVGAGLRHGVYSVDRLADRLRERQLTSLDMDNALSYNFIDIAGGHSESSRRQVGVVTVDDVGITVGPRAYLRAIVGSDLLLSLRVPHTIAWRGWAERALTNMNEGLRAAAKQ